MPTIFYPEMRTYAAYWPALCNILSCTWTCSVEARHLARRPFRGPSPKHKRTRAADGFRPMAGLLCRWSGSLLLLSLCILSNWYKVVRYIYYVHLLWCRVNTSLPSPWRNTIYVFLFAGNVLIFESMKRVRFKVFVMKYISYLGLRSTAL